LQPVDRAYSTAQDRSPNRGGFHARTIRRFQLAQTGQVIGISFWESESDLHATDELGRQAREDVQQRGGGQSDIERVDRDVVVDDTP
jgi:hypothetical protein